MADDSLYKTLGVARNASRDEIRKAFKRLEKRYHIDDNSDPSTFEKFKEISTAYEILSNANKRALYDKYGLEAVQGHGHGVDCDQHRQAEELSFMPHMFGGGGMFGMGMPDIDMMGMGFGMGAGRRKKPDTMMQLEVTLEDLYNGNTVKVPVTREVLCTTCKGLGARANAVQQCVNCQGRGRTFSYRQLARGLTQRVECECAVCRGTGELISDKDKCRQCKGQKILQKVDSLAVHVEAGMRNNQKILFPGKGNQGVNMEAGNFYIVLQQTPHETFKRVGHDLVLMLPVSLTEALCGFQTVVKQLDGRSLLVRTNRGEVLEPDCVKQIEGEGMPHAKALSQKGNLIIKFDIQFPENHFCDGETLKVLEAMLPPRPNITIPAAEDVEEVNMFDLSPDDSGPSRSEAYASDDEEMGQGTPMRCAQQ